MPMRRDVRQGFRRVDGNTTRLVAIKIDNIDDSLEVSPPNQILSVVRELHPEWRDSYHSHARATQLQALDLCVNQVSSCSALREPMELSPTLGNSLRSGGQAITSACPG